LEQIIIPAASTSMPQRWKETGSQSASTSEPGQEQHLDQIIIPVASTSMPQRWNEKGSQSASTSKPGQEQQLDGIIQAASTSTLPGWNDYNLPRSDVLSGTRGEYLRIGVPLYEASIRCDWNAAKAIFDKYPEKQLFRCSITENNETALHVAASLKRSNKQVENFVKNLVDLMTYEDLELENSDGDTALLLAAVAGNIQAVKIMVIMNRTLLTIPGSHGMMPLIVAASYGNYEVVKFLYGCSRELFYDDENRVWLLQKCVEADMFDVALKIVKNGPGLGSGDILRALDILEALARKPYAFSVTKSNIIKRITSPVFALIGLRIGAYEKESEALQLLKLIWEDIAKGPKEVINYILGLVDPVVDSANSKSNIQLPRIQYSSRLMFIAAEMGNTTFLVELIRRYLDLIWKVKDHNMSIFHIAVKYRHEGIYNLLYEIGSMRDKITPLTDDNYNNMLHLAGKRTTKVRLADVSGPALQMQRELLWFKEVRSMLHPDHRERKNKDGQTPHDLFIEEHKELIREGEKWLKETANQCMVVATLIATIAFAAAFTVPGGYNQTDGIPIFYRKPTFVAFVVSDAMSLFLSSTSILTFLSILTSRYAECDFVESLPTKLMLGVATLFLSITAMMITFSVSFFILYHKEMQWVPISIGVFALMPVILYIVLQYHVLSDVIRSTYGSRYLFKPGKQVLYYVNPRV
ncbi:hypothetical protein M8C21_032184, partial [Ambrosia artemisiifolia]